MTLWPLPVTTAIAAAPALAALLAPPSMERRRARMFGVGVTLAVLALTIGASIAWNRAGCAPASDFLDPGRLAGRAPLFVIDELNSLLLPFAALIFAFVVLVQPATLALERALRRLLLSEAVTLATFLTTEPLVLAFLWCVASSVCWVELRLRGRDARAAARVFAAYTVVSCASMVLGAVLLYVTAAPARVAATVLLALAVMLRKGVVPLHSWLPELCSTAPLPVSVLFNAPQIGAWVAVRLVAPYAPVWVLEWISLTALATAVYGAGVALVQVDARRLFAWLFLSQSALILVGLESQASVAQAGGLSAWISSGLALAGFGMTIAALEARRGPLSLERFAGGYDRKPLLAASFLVLGLASVGFPGTLGFVGQEALVHGVVSDFPHFGFAVLVASMLNGMTVLRAYFILFCGRDEPGRVSQTLRARERLGFVALAALLLVTGLFPSAFVRSRTRAVERLRSAMTEPSASSTARVERSDRGSAR